MLREWQTLSQAGLSPHEMHCHQYLATEPATLTTRMNDTRLRCHQSKLLNPHHPPPGTLTEDAPRDRSVRWLEGYQNGKKGPLLALHPSSSAAKLVVVYGEHRPGDARKRDQSDENATDNRRKRGDHPTNDS
jgi:hypothetical protein